MTNSNTQPDSDDARTPDDAPPTEAHPRRRRRWGRWGLVAAAVLLLLVLAFLPQILSLGPCRRYALGQLNRRLPVRVAVADWSLSWFGAQEVEAVEVRSQRVPHGTAEGRPAARVQRVTLRQGLAALLLDRSRIGPVRITGAEVWADELEAALAAGAEPEPERIPAEAPPARPGPPTEGEAPEPAPPPTPAAQPEPTAVEPGPAPIIPESVYLEDLVLHADEGRLRVLKASLRRGEARDAFEADLQVIHGHRTGSARVTGSVTGLSSDWRGADAVGLEAVLSCTDLPLAPLVALGGAGEAVQVTGAVTGETTVSRSRDGRVAMKTDLRGTGLEASGEALGADRPALQTLTLTAEATYDQGALTVAALALDSPVGTARASGTFALAASDEAPAGSGSAHVEADLARIAAMLPDTLNLHEDLTIEGGTFIADADAASDGSSSRLHLVADLTEFRGTRAGQAVTLTPLHLDADLARAHAASEPADEAAPETAPAPADEPTWFAMAETIEVKTLVLAGGFGAVEATGRLNHLVLDADLNLARATEEVERFADLGGYGAAGTAVVHLETGLNGTRTDRRDGGTLTASTRATLKDLVLRLPGEVRLREPEAVLSAEVAVILDDRRRLASAELADLALEARTASLTAGGTLRRAGQGWAFEARAAGGGTVANLAGVAAAVLPSLMSEEPAEPDADEADTPAEPRSAGWVETVLPGLRRAAGTDGPAADGAWTVTLEAGGTVGQALAVKTDTAVSGLLVPPVAEGEEPFRLDEASLSADVLYAPGEARQVTVNALAVTVPGAGLTVEGPTTVTIQGPATRLDRPAAATAVLDLPALAAMLRPLGYLPADPKIAGRATITFTVTPGAEPASPGVAGYAAREEGGPTKATLAVRAEQVDLAWSDGRGYTDPLLRVAATGTLSRDEAGQARTVEVAEWSVATAAGSLKGTARGERTPAGWRWDADARGEGPIGPVAHTIARLLGAEPTPIEGVWTLAATYTGRQTAVAVDLSATDLTIPREARPEGTRTGRPEEPTADVHLDDVHLAARAAVGADGQVRVDQASVTAPGLTAEAEGTVRLPTPDQPRPSADGHVEAAVDLARLALVLRPFGTLGEGDRLAGNATFAGEVRTDPTGLGGSGTVTLTDLEVHLAEAGSTFREAEARLPVAFAYVNAKRRWEIAAKDMSAATVSGAWRVAVEEADPAPPKGIRTERLDVACDLAFDGGRVREALGQALPETLRLSGPYRVLVRLAGPLPAEGPWHRRLASMEGDGLIEVGHFTYVTLAGGEGTVRWDLADGSLRLSPDPDEMSRLTLADGTVTLAGRIDLTGREPHLVIAEPVRAIEDLPLAGEQIREFLKYASPVLAASVGASGRLTLDVQALDLPMAEGAGDRAVGDFAYHIDEFQTQLMGPLGRLVEATAAEPQSIAQTLGPVQVRLRDGVFHVPEHDLRYTETVSLRFGGRIGLDKRMNVMVGVPVTRALMQRYNVSERAMPYLKDVVLAVPLSGTIDAPEIDSKALAKRLGELALEAIKRETLKRLGDWLKR